MVKAHRKIEKEYSAKVKELSQDALPKLWEELYKDFETKVSLQ